MTNSDSDPGASLRAEMAAQVADKANLSDPRIAAVMKQVPRHVFVPGVALSEAYADQAIVTRYRDGLPTSSASQPTIVAIMLDQLRPPMGGSILEIGAGTGYNAALLSKLVGPSGRVISIDIDPEVAAEASSHLATADVTNVQVICADGGLGWSQDAPYEGIIATAGVSDLAPAWVDQLATGGRLVTPLSIRGVQQCVAFIRADGHLRSDAVCDCGFMPLTGIMANTDRHDPVPGHEGVYVHAAADTEVDAGLVGDVLDDPRAAEDLGITASAPEVGGSLRRWLAFHEPGSAALSYIGPAERAEASGVPAVLELQYSGRAQRLSPCLIGRSGFAALDRTASTFGLAVRPYGEAEEQMARLAELVTAWDAAGRPGTDRVRIDAYPSGSPLPQTTGSSHRMPHATFVVSST